MNCPDSKDGPRNDFIPCQYFPGSGGKGSSTTGWAAHLIKGNTIDALCKFNRARKKGDNREGGHDDKGGHLNTENY